MRVLMLRPQLELGGVSRHIELLARGLYEQGHNITVATAGGEACERVAATRTPLLICPELYPSRPLGLLMAVFHLSALVRSSGIDILHSHHRFTTIVGRSVARLTGRPLVVTIHEFKANWAGLAFLWTGNAVITPSNALREHLASFYKVPRDRIMVVPNAVAPPPAPASRRLAEGRRPLTIAYIGRLSKEKGVRYFVESLPLISRAVPDLRAVIVGDGPEGESLRTLATSLGLRSSELFLGAREDVPALMGEIDLVVVPSLAESFSLVALEAMHQGLSVVATRVGGLAELVRDDETGLLVQPGDPAALAKAVVELLRDPAHMASLGARGREVAQREYSPGAMVTRTLEVYSRLLAQV